ncbi:hypothetical protein JCGZ_16578 [Jatropha curcas]|uniref:C2H2-type domain-containing protein n=2 Tax=Jatropha curcas TaxID=180498 RepID=A0A067KBJ7_JATCU|nr:hypothetical protein JCGZ_16578 [Jatropha curcas]
MGSTEIITKGKRTKRQRAVSPLRLAVTSSSSSSGGAAPNEIIESNTSLSSSTPATSIEFSGGRGGGEEEEDMANCLILLAQGTQKNLPKLPASSYSSPKAYVYECKTCNRCFPSFQALGGHRASHKKPNTSKNSNEEKKVFLEEDDDQVALSLQIVPNRSLFASSNSNINVKSNKVHECSICGAEFSSGQALGGHMRRHRAAFASNTNSNSMKMSMSLGTELQEAKKPRNSLQLDLNLPAPEDDIRESKFHFASKEQVLVFSSSSLVDCHY